MIHTYTDTHIHTYRAKANEEDGEDRWYVPVMIILGVYCVLMLSLAF